MAQSSPEKPNVIVFFTDQQRWDSCGLHGNPLELTPNWDRMARAGTHCPNAFTCQPVCAPARATLQTGLYARNAGVYRNGLTLKPEARTLAHCFKEAGYHTAYVGKWHLGSQDPVPIHEQAGYDHWMAANVLEFVSRPYGTVLYDKEGQSVDLPGYRVDALTDEAIRWIDRRKDEAFFLFLSFLEPHFQNHVDDYPAPDGYRERYAGRWVPPDLAALQGSTHQHLGGYWGMVKRLDEALGRLLDALKSLDLTRRTLLVFTTDHGCHFKTRNDEYKRSCHDASIRIPLAFQGPGFDGGGQRQEMISLVDVPPTILEGAGLPIPAHMEGRSILGLNRGAREGWPDDVFVEISESQVGRCVRTRRWKYSVRAPNEDGWAHDGSDRYVEDCLYDLESDPYELRNLVDMDSHEEICCVMRQRLIRRMIQAGEKKPTIGLVPRCASGQRRVDPGEERL